ncbi:hypothetical protein [Pandoraea bronchicola]|uniref:DUF930 domain-containing protein n=1 Tax=Pandoraea bronchicola TaxID=2508287 RepID=A0A5E5BY85_9BURK|nr:hypothetical protein [Pandoraea bronchicola]VVE90514.1 hypothetical protein PBR20603_04499 [Pandoraea bronchicola]
MLRNSFPGVGALLIGVLFCCIGSVSHAGGAAEDHVSPAQQRRINAGIAKLRLSEERSIAQGWGAAKQVAEFICRPSAQPAIAEKLKGVDRVFLGTDAADSLTLLKARKLVGVGRARFEGGWRDFSFECLMDPRTAKVEKFLVLITPPSTV